MIGRAPRRATHGYTLVEVMMAVAIMTVGSVGILSLTQATTMGNRDAREMSTAVDLTRLYIERVRRDALVWNSPGNVVGTEFLLAGLVTNPDVWFTPAPTIGSHAFDFQGNDTATAADMHYCTNLRASWVIGTDAARVDVRVWWHRTASNTNRGAFTCATAAATVTAELAADAPRLRAVHASTVIHWHRLN
jgi:prepilin-type N-terminal cleavage/methylation domain-containing protein